MGFSWANERCPGLHTISHYYLCSGLAFSALQICSATWYPSAGILYWLTTFVIELGDIGIYSTIYCTLKFITILPVITVLLVMIECENKFEVFPPLQLIDFLF